LVVSVVLGTSEKLAVVLVIALTVLYTLRGRHESRHLDRRSATAPLLNGSAVSFFVLLHRIPGGWAEVTRRPLPRATNCKSSTFPGTSRTKYTFWSGLIGGAFLTMASHGTDQNHRAALARRRNERDSRAALPHQRRHRSNPIHRVPADWRSAFCFSPNTLPFCPPANAPTASFLFSSFKKMQPVSAGLMITSIVAVAMSNASGSLNSLAASKRPRFLAIAWPQRRMLRNSCASRAA